MRGFDCQFSASETIDGLLHDLVSAEIYRDAGGEDIEYMRYASRSRSTRGRIAVSTVHTR